MDKNVIIKPSKAKPLFYHHPWVFPQSVKEISKDITDGDIVSVFDEKKNFIGYGFYQTKNSPILVKMYSYDKESKIDIKYIETLIDTAFKLRANLDVYKHEETDCIRLINSEGDFLPGLTADLYKDVVTIQLSSVGLSSLIKDICESIRKMLKAYFKIDMRAAYYTERYIESNSRNAYLQIYGSPIEGSIQINENNVKYEFDIEHCQKTGHYMDQRDNRLWISLNLNCSNVLDCFSYTGGFALNYALNHRTSKITSVESSKFYCEVINKNIVLNSLKNINVVNDDTFLYLSNNDKMEHDLIILDPPKFVTSRNQLKQGIKRYVALNKLAIDKLKQSGYLVTCSCSGIISDEIFEDILLESAIQANVNMQIIYKNYASIDHPVHINCSEGKYLKFYVLYKK